MLRLDCIQMAGLDQCKFSVERLLMARCTGGTSKGGRPDSTWMALGTNESYGPLQVNSSNSSSGEETGFPPELSGFLKDRTGGTLHHLPSVLPMRRLLTAVGEREQGAAAGGRGSIWGAAGAGGGLSSTASAAHGHSTLSQPEAHAALCAAWAVCSAGGCGSSSSSSAPVPFLLILPLLFLLAAPAAASRSSSCSRCCSSSSSLVLRVLLLDDAGRR